MSTIGEALRARETELFVDREVEVAAFLRWLDAPHPLLSLTGPGGVGKSMLIRRFRGLAEERGREVIVVDARTSEPTPGGLARAITGRRDEDAIRWLNEHKAILMLDTFEEMTPLTSYLQEEFLPPLDTEVRIVLSGRHAPGRAWRDWAPLIHRLQLEGLSPEHSRAYLARRGVADHVAEDILSVAGGLPLALSLAADVAIDHGLRRFRKATEWRHTVQQLVEDVMRDLRDPLLRRLLEAAAVVRQFTEETLSAVVDDRGIRNSFEELCRLSIVKPAERGLLLHDDVRRVLIEDLKIRRPALLTTLRRRAREHFRALISTGRSGDNDWLIEEHLYLLENSVLQEHYFHESPKVWVEQGRPEDVSQLVAMHQAFYANPEAISTRPPVEEGTRAFIEAMLRMPGTDVAVARRADGPPVGFGLLVPVCGRSVAFLPPDGPISTLIDTALGPGGIDGLPESPDDTDAFFMTSFVLSGVLVEEAVGALGRYGMKFLMRPALLLGASGDPMYQNAMASTGFTRIPGIGPSVVPGTDVVGFVMDLRKVGPDAWVDAISSGRPLPNPLEGEALNHEVREVLLHWHDDGRLAGSALVPHALLRAEAPDEPPADAVRRLITDALNRAKEAAHPNDALGIRCVELAYLDGRVSHERVAERLNISRSTFFRSLRRGVSAVARALA